jgi:hypothetical protein
MVLKPGKYYASAYCLGFGSAIGAAGSDVGDARFTVPPMLVLLLNFCDEVTKLSGFLINCCCTSGCEFKNSFGSGWFSINPRFLTREGSLESCCATLQWPPRKSPNHRCGLWRSRSRSRPNLRLSSRRSKRASYCMKAFGFSFASFRTPGCSFR